MTVAFKPRNSEPAKNDRNWITYRRGGDNYCMEIKDGSVVPNCVGYSWGRWRELLGKYHELSRGNAEVWWGKNDGYKRGQTPKLGAIACWSQGHSGDGSDGAGHVSVVEDILADGSIVTSNSAYKGTAFYMQTIRPPFNLGSKFKFQGFIYAPVEFVKEAEKPLKSEDTIAWEIYTGKGGWGNNPERRQRLIDAGYDATSVQAKVNALLNSSKPNPTKNEYGQNVKVGDSITFSYIRKSTTSGGLKPYYKQSNGRGYGVVKKIHSGLSDTQGAYEVALKSKDGNTIGFVAPTNTY